MKDNKIAIIDPVGVYGGMNYTTHGYCLGFIANNWKPYLFTCSDTTLKFPEIETVFSFKDIWKKKFRLFKLIMLIYGYVCSFTLSNRKKVSFVNLHFFKWGGLNTVIVILAKIFFRGKIVVTIHDVESFHYKSNPFFSGYGAVFIDGFMFFNEFSKDKFEKIYGLRKPFCIVSHGNYLHYFDKLPHRNKIDGDKIRILFFGQLKRIKGIDILLEAFKIVCEKSSCFELTIVGRPWKMSRIEMIERLKSYNFGSKLNFNLKFVTDSEATNYYMNSDIVVLPYTRIYNSGVLLLSFSYGRTVITSDLPPFLELVENNVNGFTFKNEDPKDLAKTILSTVNSDLQAFGDLGHSIVKVRNDWQIETRKFIEFIQSL